MCVKEENTAIILCACIGTRSLRSLKNIKKKWSNLAELIDRKKNREVNLPVDQNFLFCIHCFNVKTISFFLFVCLNPPPPPNEINGDSWKENKKTHNKGNNNSRRRRRNYFQQENDHVMLVYVKIDDLDIYLCLSVCLPACLPACLSLSLFRKT